MSNKKILNFNAGPAAMPEDVIKQAADAVLDYNGTGMSILSIPHRSNLFDDILDEAKALVMELCGVNDDYEVLWMQGGGRLQFCMVPMNFLGENETAGYLDSGHWAADALESAKYYGNIKVLGSTREQNYTSLPSVTEEVPADLRYVHITSNNTIYGTQSQELPALNAPLIVDMSSDILSMPRDYNKCSIFYAVAQKNLGSAGVTLVVMKKDILQQVRRKLPPMLDYSVHAKNNSVLNTPPVFAVYNSLLMLRWIKQRCTETIFNDNKKKAELLYSEIERNSLFEPIVKTEDRSLMNVVFKAAKEGVEKPFLDHCEAEGITGVKGHRSVGGFRVSLYNAIMVEDVERLVAAMQQFESKLI